MLRFIYLNFAIFITIVLIISTKTSYAEDRFTFAKGTIEKQNESFNKFIDRNCMVHLEGKQFAKKLSFALSKENVIKRGFEFEIDSDLQNDPAVINKIIISPDSVNGIEYKPTINFIGFPSTESCQNKLKSQSFTSWVRNWFDNGWAPITQTMEKYLSTEKALEVTLSSFHDVKNNDSFSSKEKATILERKHVTVTMTCEK